MKSKPRINEEKEKSESRQKKKNNINQVEERIIEKKSDCAMKLNI